MIRNMQNHKILLYSTLFIVGSYFLFIGLSAAQHFLAPLLTAIILALVILPVCNWMESKMKRPVASLINTILLLSISIGFMALVSLQLKSVAEKWPEIKETMEPKIEQLKTFITENTPIKESDLERSQNGNNSESGAAPIPENARKATTTALSGIFAFLGTYLLTFVYIFFILNYRQRFKFFLFSIFPDDKQQEVDKAIHESAQIVQQYLVGKLFLIGIVAVLYAIGLGITGVSNFILISLIAASLDLIPYVGNILGFLMAMVFGYLTSGSTMVLVGIIITFSVAQFVQSYLLEPYVVGDKVDLHPFFVILVVVIGNAVWGVIGMILSIPVLAIMVVIFMHIPPLKPIGFLFSNKKYQRE